MHRIYTLFICFIWNDLSKLPDGSVCIRYLSEIYETEIDRERKRKYFSYSEETHRSILMIFIIIGLSLLFERR